MVGRARECSPLVIVFAFAAVGFAATPRVHADCTSPANAIEAENCKPGNPSTEWDVSGAGDSNLQGFATDISVDQGGTISFKVDTTASAFHIDIYRLGYYGGLGARKVATIADASVTKTRQPACLTDSTTGLLDCGNWSVSATWSVPADAVSGIYIARLAGEVGVTGASHVPFVVRQDGGTSALLFQTSDTTWQAYNRYGGISLYGGNGPGGGLSGAGRAYKVSYNRPFTTRAFDGGEDWLFNSEYPMVRWLERNGYDVAYFTGVDADRRGAEIARHKVYLSVGHDEYWSKGQRANVEQARDQGFAGQTSPVHLAFFSGNEIFWKTRWEPSIDGRSTSYRTLVCYKETHEGAKIDPSPEWTGTWRDPRFSPPSDGGRPENALSGTIFMVNGERTDSLVVPAADAQMRFWRNTPNVSVLSGAQVWTGASGTLGYEWDEDLDNGSRPAGLVRLSTATVAVPGLLQDYGSTYAAATATHHMTFHERASGALVFGAGTVQWAWGLDAEHDRFTPPVSVDMQQATVNLFADMGVQPATLQPDLLPAGASVDLVAPASDISAPANNTTVTVGTPVTIQGTASDGPPGVVGGVEVSVDGGLTWHPAEGRATWSYAWTPAQPGSYTILSRAVDDSGNLEVPGGGSTVVVSGSTSSSIWAGGGTPGTLNDFDGQEIELGVKFRSTSAGQISAIRFYKASLDSGSHTVSLWSSTGTLLGSGTSTTETASGWQQVALSSPVTIAANTTYVASYHAKPGYYAATTGYFTQAVVNGPLTALADGTDGPNGVYKYGASGFPTQSFNQTNYWVDIAFTAQSGGLDTTPPTVVSTAPTAGATGVGVSTAVTASFSEALAAASVNGTTLLLRDPGAQLVPATVTWNGSTNSAILQPTSALAASTTYTATVKGGTGGVTDVAGNPLAADFGWSFTTGTTAQSGTVSIWPGTGTPASLNLNDGQELELGLKFRSSQAGYISAIRFYKGNLDTGTHTASLWSATGTLLASAPFVAETTSGWQEVTLPSAVAIAANTTYVASYHSNPGYYVASTSYFTQAVSNGPLTALADGTDGPNGVYRYGVTGFPTQSFDKTNYWVDVVFSVNPPGPDTTPPTVVSTSPGTGTSGVLVSATVSARFSEALAPATVNGATVQLKDSSSQVVPATVAWDPTSNSATLQPTSALAYSSVYTAVVKGGSGGVTDVAGNPLGADVTWTFTTQALPPPPPPDGPGGPVLVISYSGNPFSRYYAEILRAEGLNAFKVIDISAVDATTLAQYDVAILGDMPLTAAQATLLSSWVNGGGNLIAMRPDPQLASLLGLTPTGTTLAQGYQAVDTTRAPGQGIVGQTMQFHGTATRYTLAAATPAAVAVAMLYSSATTATSNPAVTLRSVGSSGGQAAAFAFDLARSVVYTRQGNPAWAGDERDGVTPKRSDDLFYGNKSGDPQPDWVDLDKVAIPQADEQQRLLANLILTMSSARKPLPRFWYFPRGNQAVVVMAVDNHGSTTVEERFTAQDAASPAGCVVDNWQCIRSTAYIYIDALPDDATAKFWENKGFEVALHVNTNCADWSPTTLPGFFSTQMSDFFAKFPSISPLRTNRTHCIAWSDWATQPKVELADGIRFDANYYYWPPAWVNDTPGLFTGSGMPMRFADLDGTMIDVYQATTQMTDESGQTYPFTINTLLDRALGAEGYYGAFTANIHADGNTDSQAAAIVSSAKARSVPVVSAKQMLNWLDGRNGSSFQSIGWSGGVLTFGIAVGAGANGLQALLPTHTGVSPLTTLTSGGSSVPFTKQTIKGIEYAVFTALPGSYQASYTVDTTPPVISNVSVSVGANGTATVQWGTDEPATSVVRYGTAPASLTLSASSSLLVTAHTVVLDSLSTNTTYYYGVTSADASGNSASSAVSSFTVTTVDGTAPTVTLVAPNGAERLFTGSPYLIQWTATDDVGVTSIDVAASSDGGTTFTPVSGCTGLSGSAQSCTWAAPGPVTTQGRIRVTARDAAGNSGSATSSASFTIVSGAPTLTLTAPTTAVTWPIATAQTVTFNHNLGVGASIVIALSRDGGATWTTINPGFVTTSATTGSYSWAVTGPATTAARVRLTWAGNPAVSSTSGTSFAIADWITVTAPNTAVTWAAGSTQAITWNTSFGTSQTVNIDVSRDGGATWSPVAANVANATATSGTYSWVVTAPATTQARIRVSGSANAAITDASDVNFTISGTISMTAPTSGVRWAIGSHRTITWNHTLGAGQSFNILLSTDGGTTFPTTIASGVAGGSTSGSYNWVVPGPATTTARVRVVWAARTTVRGTTGNFTMQAAAITVTSPNTAVNWAIGTTRSITWNQNLGTQEAVNIDESTDGGATWTSIATNVANSAQTTGSYSWTVTGPASTSARIRVSWASDAAVFGQSSVSFTVADPFVTVTSPNTNVGWSIGSTHNLTFSHNLGTGQVVQIDLTRDGGATFAPITTFTTTSANSGSYSWVVTGPATSQARVRVTWTANPGVTDQSNVNFRIQ